MLGHFGGRRLRLLGHNVPLLLSVTNFPFEINTCDMAPGVPSKEGITKVVGTMMMTPTNDTNNFQTVTFTGSSIASDYNPDERESMASVIEPPDFTHRLTQNMTATWGN